MRAERKRNKAVLIMALILAVAMMFPPATVCTWAAPSEGEELTEPVSVTLPMTLTLKGDGAADQGMTFTFELTGEGDVPMPSGNKATVKLTAAGNGTFGPILFDKTGQFDYTITQTTAERVEFTLDKTVYHAHVYIRIGDDEKPYAVVVLQKEDEETKPAELKFENVYEQEFTSLDGSKTWDDNDNQDGKRPAKIIIDLLADGKKVDSKTVTEADDWEWTFDNLPKYNCGELITYTIREGAVGSYTMELSEDGTSVKNTHVPETTKIKVTKTWDDADDQDGKRADAGATVQLYKTVGGVKTAVGKPVTVGTKDGWSKEWKDLPVYEDGKKITYSVTETLADGTEYVKSGDDEEKEAVKDDSGTIALTNTYKPETTKLTVTKTWNDKDDQDGKRSDAGAKVQLYKTVDGVKTAVGSPVKVGTADGWSKVWKNLPVYENGKKITYSVTETMADGSEYEKSGDDEEKEAVKGDSGTIEVTNTYTPERVSVKGSKTWDDADNQDGLRPVSITVNLFADGEQIKSVTVTEEDGWKWSFTKLPKYEAGKKIEYTVTEEAVEGYETTVTGYNIKNTHVPETTEVSGSKTWNDADNQDGKRPESITINLLADGEQVDSVTVTEADGWKWSFTGLPRYNAGEEIIYTITEEPVKGYKAKVTGYDVTNTHTPATTEVSGEKTWDDGDDQDGMRPKSITVYLLANGEQIKSVKVTEADGWKWSFTGLPKYENGKKITYTVEEKKVRGYTATVNGTDITNRHKVGTTEISVEKIWDDDSDRDGIRPTGLKVTLYADGEKADEVVLNEANGWKYTWKELPLKNNGEIIEYTVEEEETEGYTAVLTGDAENGFVFTNTHEPEKTQVSGDKTWDDAGDVDGKRPKSITIRLYANGKEVASKVVTEKDGWKWTFEDLPLAEAGKEIEYTITEDPVPGYETTVKGHSVINKHTPGPKTGDDSRTGLYVGLAGGSLAAAGALFIGLRRRKKED